MIFSLLLECYVKWWWTWRTIWMPLKYFWNVYIWSVLANDQTNKHVLVEMVHNFHENAFLLVRTKWQVLEGIAMHVITVASRNHWLLLETTHDQPKPSSCESQSARIKPGCESQPHLPSRNLRLRVVTKTWRTETAVASRNLGCESQPP